MNESETRAELIDPALKAAGWGVAEGSKILREYGISAGRIQVGGRGKRDIADYVLVYKGIKLAVVEAKSVELSVGEGVMQAKKYAYKPAPYFDDYPNDYFDFIIIDECHRGGANDESNWRAILEYFSPAVQLGLTATPKRKDNVDTYKYFGEPVYIYSLKEGINDGFLTPFKVKRIKTTLDDYLYTSDDTVIEGERQLREFQDNEKTIPTILTTSQKLSTGVDARNIRNIVLLRPVNSMIEFKQIVGRGTRLFDGKDFRRCSKHQPVIYRISRISLHEKSSIKT